MAQGIVIDWEVGRSTQTPSTIRTGTCLVPSEADTCRRFVVPLLQSAGGDAAAHSISEQHTITDGRIVPVGKGFIRKPLKRVDYLLHYRRVFPLAVVEAKAAYKHAADGLQRAKDYAEMPGLDFALAINGRQIFKFNRRESG